LPAGGRQTIIGDAQFSLYHVATAATGRRPLLHDATTEYTFLDLAANVASSIQLNHSGKRAMPEGSIKKLMDKGFGFINTGKDKDLFFHSSQVVEASFEELREGQKVSYTEGRGPKGPCAENVKPI
jgi:CspA family cold shock protein